MRATTMQYTGNFKISELYGLLILGNNASVQHDIAKIFCLNSYIYNITTVKNTITWYIIAHKIPHLKE